MKKWVKENKYNILIMIIYSIVSFVILMFHEMWRDEAQAWLIARDLNPLEIIKQMKYEGHFVLWYFILVPFAKLGFSYKTINIISWLIVLPAVWLILKKAPFKSWIKVLFIFSYPMLYLYPSISRCYCLIPLAIVLIAITYQNRMKEPIKYMLSIVLLANTHIIMYGLVGMLLLTFFIEVILNRNKNTKIENKRIIISFIIAGILILLIILPLFTSLTSNDIIKEKITIQISINSFLRIFEWMSALFILDIHSFIIALIFLLIYEFKNYPKNGIIIVMAITFQYLIYFFIYSVYSTQRISTIIMIVFLFAWLQNNNLKEVKKYKINYAKIIIIILLVLNVLFRNTPNYR